VSANSYDIPDDLENLQSEWPVIFPDIPADEDSLSHPLIINKKMTNPARLKDSFFMTLIDFGSNQNIDVKLQLKEVDL